MSTIRDIGNDDWIQFKMKINIGSGKFTPSQLGVLAMDVMVFFHLTVGGFGARAQFPVLQTLQQMIPFLTAPCRDFDYDDVKGAGVEELCSTWGARGVQEKVDNRYVLCSVMRLYLEFN
jgi:hypothetical protein